MFFELLPNSLLPSTANRAASMSANSLGIKKWSVCQSKLHEHKSVSPVNFVKNPNYFVIKISTTKSEVFDEETLLTLPVTQLRIETKKNNYTLVQKFVLHLHSGFAKCLS